MELPGYRILRELGRGGMATVYLAEQLSLRRPVAIKRLDPARAAGDPNFAQRFLREGRLVAQLRHRHIVAIHDVGVHEGAPYLALEYLQRGSVADQTGRMEPAEALRCVAEIAGALDAAHRQGIVHRDVKPENILLHDDGAYLLGDFGIARVVDASSVLTREGCAVGTPAYMSPEQWRGGGEIDGRADIYSLGIVLYQLLTGRVPYAGSDGWAIGMQHLAAPLPKLPSAYRALQPLLERMLAKSPEQRFASGAEVVAAVGALQRSGRLPARAELIAGAETAEQARHLRAAAKLFATAAHARGRGWRWALAAALLLAAGAAAWVGLREQPAPGAASGATVLAVLPCTRAPGLAQDWLATALADELAIRLARLPGLRVLGIEETAPLVARRLTARQLGAELGASHVLACSLREEAGDRLRVAVELSEAASDALRWNGVEAEAGDDILRALAPLVLGLGGRLAGQLDEATRASLLRTDTADLEALRLYHEARVRCAAGQVAVAGALQHQALARDPGFTRARGACG